MALNLQDILDTYKKINGQEALFSLLSNYMSSSSSAAAASTKKIERSLSSLSNQELRDILCREFWGKPEGLRHTPKFPKKEDLIAEIERLRAGSSSAEAPSEEKPKKQRAPSAWNAYIEEMALTEDFAEWKKSQAAQKGNLKMAYAALVKSSDPEGYQEFVKNFSAKHGASEEHPSSAAAAASSSSSVVSSASSVSSEGAEKKRRGPKKLSEMTADELAAHEEKKKARQAKKAAEKSEPAAKAAEIPLPASPAESEDEDEEELAVVKIAGTSFYWNQETGDLYKKKSTGPGKRVGSYDGISATLDSQEPVKSK